MLVHDGKQSLKRAWSGQVNH